MINVGVVGLGKMGLSHLSMLRPHPDVQVTAICDPTRYMLDILGKYTGLATYSDYDDMLERAELDAVVIVTPSHLHASMVEKALRRDLHVFCEKPLFLNPLDGERLTGMAQSRGLVTQVGYHNRFVGSFSEAKRLLEAGAIGTPSTALAEAYGPVVLKTQGKSWRSQPASGGGALYDYAAHPLDLLTWYLGPADAVAGSRLPSIFSRQTDDAVMSSIRFGAVSALLSVNWSDESQRKMTTKVTLWGTHGRIHVDRQEIQVYRRSGGPAIEGYPDGWTVRYTTELQEAPWFYVRGEEYSQQLDAFVTRVVNGDTEGTNTFASAARTDRLIAMIAHDAAGAADGAVDGATPSLPVPGPVHGGTRMRALWTHAKADLARVAARVRSRQSVRTAPWSDAA